MGETLMVTMEFFESCQTLDVLKVVLPEYYVGCA